MNHFNQMGLISVGFIVTSSISVVNVGGFPSVVGAALSPLLFFTRDSIKSTGMGRWALILGDFCRLSTAALGLTHIFEFYDEGTSQFFHFVPTDSLPIIMPIAIIVVVTALFILGLEDAYILHLITTVFLVAALSLFSIVGVSNAKWNINFQTKDIDLNITHGIAFWLSMFHHSTKDKCDVVTSLAVFSFTSTILSSLPRLGSQFFVGSKGFSWYPLLQVPLSACCLGMAMYELNISTVDAVSRHVFLSQLSVENPVTGTKVRAYLFIGCCCCVLVSFIPLSSLIYLGSSAAILSFLIDSIVSLNLNFKLVNSTTRNETSKYAAVQVDESQILNDNESSCSSDTDIDDIVNEYLDKVEVLGSPIIRTDAVSSILIICLFPISLSIYMSLVLDCYVLTVIGTVVTFALILYVNHRMPRRGNILNLTICLANALVLFSVFNYVGVFLSLWMIAGGVLSQWRAMTPKIHRLKTTRLSLKSVPIPLVTVSKQRVQV